MQNLLGQTGINPNTAIIVGGVVKVLVGELTEEGKVEGRDAMHVVHLVRVWVLIWS